MAQLVVATDRFRDASKPGKVRESGSRSSWWRKSITR